MSQFLRLSQRDLVLLEALALRVRLVGQRQAAEALWASHLANARRRLRRLVSEGMISRQVLPAMPLPEFNEPVVRWQPGQAVPHAEAISFQLQGRWRFRALRPTVVYFPTSMTVSYFGGRERPQSLVTHTTHDLGVTAVWLRFLSHSRDIAATWTGEDILAPSRVGQKLPDAALVDQHGEPTMLIEFGGSYGPARVADFHDDAAARGLPYQIW